VPAIMTTMWVTGARGFLGRYLVRQLAADGHHVGGVGHGHAPETIASSEGLAGWVNGDIHAGSLDLLHESTGAPTVVFHLAGGSAVGSSIANPVEDFERTVSAASRLFDWIRLRCPECAVVAVSSAAVYGAGHTTPIAENTSGTPYSPYGFHKSMMEGICRSYGQTYGLRSVILRVFSAYGIGLRRQLLWDTCSRLARSAGTLTFDGSGAELRDWIEARDIARLASLIGATMPSAEVPILNVATGTGHSVRDVVQTVMDAWGARREVSFTHRSRPGDPLYLVADTSRLRAAGFIPQVEFEQGVDAYVRWFRQVNGC
jgi:UDP-glucose 4-epimerase